MLCPRGSEASSLARRNKPPVGFEPTTSRLLSGCSAHQAKEAMEKGALDRVLKIIQWGPISQLRGRQSRAIRSLDAFF